VQQASWLNLLGETLAVIKVKYQPNQCASILERFFSKDFTFTLRNQLSYVLYLHTCIDNQVIYICLLAAVYTTNPTVAVNINALLCIYYMSNESGYISSILPPVQLHSNVLKSWALDSVTWNNSDRCMMALAL